MTIDPTTLPADAELVEAIASTLAERQRLGDIPRWTPKNAAAWRDHARDALAVVREHEAKS